MKNTTPKRVKYKGQWYDIAFISEDYIVVNLPEKMIYGYISRMPISKREITSARNSYE